MGKYTVTVTTVKMLSDTNEGKIFEEGTDANPSLLDNNTTAAYKKYSATLKGRRKKKTRAQGK
jgi:hypothetical protein